MTIISAGIVNKQGRIILSRQFSNVSRVRIEGLLSAFPRLLESATNTQVTYMAAGSVCYVYQPLEDMFLILITTIKSNLVEDLEMLRLISRIIPEYAPEGITEASLEKSTFEIFFAMDEIVGGGKREDTSIEQIQTYLEMDSYEEKKVNEEKQQQMANARRVTAEQAKLLKNRRYAGPLGSGAGGGGDPSYSGFGSDAVGGPGSGAYSQPSQPYLSPPIGEPAAEPSSALSPPKSIQRLAAPRVAMRLGAAPKKDASSRVQTEIAARPLPGQPTPEPAAPPSSMTQPALTAVNPAGVAEGAVHVRVEEKFSVALDREGEASAVEVKGELSVLVSDPAFASVRFQLGPVSDHFQFRAHTKIHKELFASDQVLVMAGGKPFPTQQSVTILRWRLAQANSVQAPISFACWAQPGGITIEYELTDHSAPPIEQLTLVIPMYGALVGSIEPSTGSTSVNSAGEVLWQLQRVDPQHNPSGNIEIHLAQDDETQEIPPEAVFFPVKVSFFSKVSVGLVQVREVVNTETGLPVPFSQQITLTTDRFIIE